MTMERHCFFGDIARLRGLASAEQVLTALNVQRSQVESGLRRRFIGDVMVDLGLPTSPPVSYTHLRAHETPEHHVCRPLLEKKKISFHTGLRSYLFFPPYNIIPCIHPYYSKICYTHSAHMLLLHQ